MRTYAFLADIAASTTRDKPLDPNDVKPGWVALGIVVLLIIATFFLCRSFLAHARKAQKPWEGEDADPGVRRTTPHDRR
ncbi:hypothetical protein [Aeromicrobium stalagmiti]|uniref:hypothetical protein n=1 Tax=Aeromicrobium stalagmiti TaxID=2738988 RepID=UPI0015699F14|nr:hypothetical protein [Aeromicrobium stalagmiti]NRQ51685.1 hypothetical protein [Aeromicrobium stalagmiti]